MVIDFHTHIFPEKIVDKAIKILEDNILQVSGVVEKAHIDGRLESLKASMQKNNIDYSVVMPIATNPHQTESINKFACIVNSDEKVYSFGSVHPESNNVLDELKLINESGLIGIKLHPQYQEFFIDSPQAIKILKIAEELGLYVMLHAGEDKGKLPPLRCTPERLKNALGCVAGDKIIAAHMGGYNMWEDVLKHLCKTPVYLDTSYSVGVMDDELAKEIIKIHGADKILFATDSPWMSQGFVLESFKNLNLDKQTQDMILFENGAKILGLNLI